MRLLIPLFLLVGFVYAQTNIVVSILPQQTFVEKIGGEKVNVIKETPLAKNWSENLIHMARTIANN